MNMDSSMEDWKPFLHTLLFSNFSSRVTPPLNYSSELDSDLEQRAEELGEPFLFPAFRIYSLTTFLAACLLTFGLALLERVATYFLEAWFDFSAIVDQEDAKDCTPVFVSRDIAMGDGSSGGYKKFNVGSATAPQEPCSWIDDSRQLRTFEQQASPSSQHIKRSCLTHISSRQSKKRRVTWKLFLKSTLLFVVSLLRYILMIIGMGMDWFVLLCIVSGLSLGQLGVDLYKVHRHSSSPINAGQDRIPLSRIMLHQGADGTLQDADRMSADAQREAGVEVHRRASSSTATIVLGEASVDTHLLSSGELHTVHGSNIKNMKKSIYIETPSSAGCHQRSFSSCEQSRRDGYDHEWS